ncbi:CpsD/CapB family tyrosine-protein kinase, partial [Candidatus Desantisbacteria bacterium]|nr:CpsD/CapB family tyrosine-protein kinase [Candidatus Desantisbacteria bacterium]
MPEKLLTTIREKRTPEAKKKVAPDNLSATSIAYPKDDSGIDARIVTYHSPKTPISEQYRIIRTNLQRVNPEHPPRLIAVSSSIHSEGKTTSSVNLAIALAQDLHKNILLVDCDLRKPNIHNLLGLRMDGGMSDILMKGVGLDTVFKKTRVENLTVLTSGRIPSNPAELLGSHRMQEVLIEFKNRFDYVILDTPPVLAITDTGILGALVDGVVIVVQAWRTQREALARTKSLLANVHAKTIGYILTNVEHFVPGYLSNYGYHYGYGQYSGYYAHS